MKRSDTATIVGVETPRLEIVWLDRPGCTGHLSPCRGCDDYCELGSVDELLGEVYGERTLCHGQEWHHQTTTWRATISFKWSDTTRALDSVSYDAETYAEALAGAWALMNDLLADVAADRINKHPYDG